MTGNGTRIGTEEGMTGNGTCVAIEEGMTGNGTCVAKGKVLAAQQKPGDMTGNGT